MGVLEVKGLYKYYGKKCALKNVNLTGDLGEIVGLFGPNGSGKTTLLKLIIGFLRPSSGSIKVDGKDINYNTRAIVSFLPDNNLLPSWMKIKDAFNFYKDFFPYFEEKKFKDLLEYFDLKFESKIKELSKGEQEKVCLSLAISRKAKVYLLDEPLGGIDPASRERILTGILKNYREDSLMIISTHLIDDVESIIDRAVFISNGEILIDGKAETLREEKKMSIDKLFRNTF
uniref:ABC transporter ATP-binding protein n=1 Tax=Dictyoglomus thermophilum TaxID=14 RepID=A0A7C3RHP2_DICTH